MDRRKLKKLPSLLGRANDTSSDRSNRNKADDSTKSRKQRLTKSRSRSPDENLGVSSPEGSPVLSRSKSHNVGKTLMSSTQLSSSARNADNVTTRRRLISISPVRNDALSDESEDDTFISKSKKNNKSLDTSKTSTAASLDTSIRSTAAPGTPASKGKRGRSTSSDSESKFASTSRPRTKRKQSRSPKKNGAGKSPPKKSIGLNKKSRSTISAGSSITNFAPEAMLSSEEDTEENFGAKQANVTRKPSQRNVTPLKKNARVIISSAEEDAEENLGAKQANVTGKSSQRNVTPLKKKKRTSSGRFSVSPVAQEEGSTDDDIFAEVTPEKSKGKSQSSPEGTNKDKRRSDESVNNSSRPTRSQRKKISPTGKNVVHHLKSFLKSGGILLTKDGPNLLCKSSR